MNTVRKFFAALMLLSFTVFCAPLCAQAQTGTLGEESPYLFCAFYNENGDAVDGNALPSGEYRVDVVLQGMENAAVMQFEARANLSSGVLTDLSVLSTYADTDNSFEEAAAEYIDDEQIAVILVSENEDTSPINSEGTVIASLSVTVNCNGTIDFNDYFNFVTDSDLTFFEADFGDGDDCYALSEGEGIEYTVYPMTADVTPELSNNIIISGTVLISQDENGNTGTFGARGINFKVGGEYVKASDGTNAVTSSVAGHYGEFEIEVPKGTTEITLTGASTVDRTVTLSGNADISGAIIPIIYCDYNKDINVNAVDFGFFNKRSGETTEVYDLNNDLMVNAVDYGFFKLVLNKSIVYSELSLDN